jgi:Ion transport protein
MHQSSNEPLVGEVPSAGKKRQLMHAADGNAKEAPKEKARGLRALGSRFRRQGALNRTPSATGPPTLDEAPVSENVLREAQFMNGLPLKAPFVPEEVCSGCGKAECECEPESDDGEDQEEAPKSWLGTSLEVVSDRSGRIVNDQRFEIFIIAMITLNSLMLGVSTFDFIADNPSADRAIRTVDMTFLIIFTVELWLQFLHKGYNLFFDGWLLFDLFIVVMSWTLESVSVLRSMRIRSLRIFRAFRLTTKIRILRRLVEVRGTRRHLLWDALQLLS